MKTSKIAIALCLLATTTFVACEKDKNEPNLTAKEKMLVNNWKLESLTMPKASNPEVDSSIVKECTEKATVVFNANKGFDIIDPNKNCDSTILTYDKGTWTLSAAGDELTLKGKRTIKWQVKTLTENSIKATFRDSTSVEHNYIKTITLKK